MDSDEIVFGPFVLDGARGHLRRGGASLPVRRKALAVLRLLASRAGRLVTNEELRAAVWPGVTVTPQTLTNVVRELRIALDDPAESPRWIRTVRGRGYVFVGSVAPELARPSPPRWIVGRDEALERLGALWTTVAAGRSAVAFVTGDPGIGKTTLVEEAVALVTRRERAALVGRGGCAEQHGGGEAYLPVLESLDEILGAPGRHPERTGLLRELAPTWLVQFPWRVTPEESALLERSLAGATGRRMLREGLTLLRELGARSPLVLVLEDLHWSDRATLDLLAAIARRPLPAPVLLLATARLHAAQAADHPVGGLVRDLVRRGDALHVPVAPFDLPQVTAYLTARFDDATVAARLARSVWEHSAGHPLFLGRLVDNWVACGAVAPAGDGSWRVDEPAIAAVGVPPTLRDVVDAEIDALAPLARDLLATASVAGAPVTADELASVLEVDPVAIERECESLSRAGRLLRTEPAARTAPRRYAFTHEAYRRIAEDRLGPVERRHLRLRLAETLERAHTDDPAPVAARLAALFDRAARPDRAAPYFERAAAFAERRFAYREVSDYLRAALARFAPDTDPALLGSLQVRLGAATSLTEGYSTPAVAQAFADAARHYRRAHDHAPEDRSAAAGLFLAEMGLARLALTRGQQRVARSHTDRLLRLAQTVVPELSAPACYWSGCIAALRGDLREAQRLLDEATSAAPPPGVLRHTDLQRLIDSVRALVLTSMGRGAAARLAERDALARSRALAQPADLAHAWLLAAERAAMARDLAAGRIAAAEALRLADESGLASFGVLAELLQAFFDADATPAARAAAMHRALDARRRLGDAWNTPMLLGLLAETQLAARDPAGALGAVDAGLARAVATGELHYQAELRRLRAACLRALDGRRAAARVAGELEHAITVARAGGAGLWALRAATDLARLWASDRRRAGESEALLARALADVDPDPGSAAEVGEARALLHGRLPAGARSA